MVLFIHPYPPVMDAQVTSNSPSPPTTLVNICVHDPISLHENSFGPYTQDGISRSQRTCVLNVTKLY